MAKSPPKKKFKAAFGVTITAETKPSVVKSALRKMVTAGLSGQPSGLDDNEKSAIDGMSFTSLAVDPVEKANAAAAKTEPAKAAPAAKKPRARAAAKSAS